jgi:hypothetical protein
MVATPRLNMIVVCLALCLSGISGEIALAAGSSSASSMGARDASYSTSYNTSVASNATFQNQVSAGSNSANSGNSFNFNLDQQITSGSTNGEYFRLSVLSVEWQAVADMTSHEIDPTTLNLITNLTYTFVIHPALQGDNGDAQLPNGKYLARFAVLLASPAAQRFSSMNQLGRKLMQSERMISWTQQIVEVRGGSITTQVTLPFRNVSATTIMNNLLIELSPMKNNGLEYMNNGKIEVLPVRPTILAGPFLALSREGHIIGNAGVSPLKATPRRKNTLSQYIADAEYMQSIYRNKIPHYNSPRESAAAYAKEHNLKMITVNSPELRDVLTRDWTKSNGVQGFLDLLTTKDNSTVKLYENGVARAALCSLLEYRFRYEPRLNYLPFHCVMDPNNYLRVAKYVHVGSIGEMTPESFRRRQLKFMVSGNFMVGRNHSNDTFMGVSINPFVFATRIVEALGLPSPVNFNYSVNETNSRSQSENMILSNSTPMDVNTISADIPLKRYLTCISLTPPTNIRGIKFDPNTPNNGFYICNDREEKDTVVTEEYAHIYERTNESAMLDNLSAAAQGTNFSLRGDRDLLSFFYTIRLKQTPDHYSTYTASDAIGAAVMFMQSTESATPGIINVPVEAIERNYGAPTFWQKYLGTYQENFLMAAEN